MSLAPITARDREIDVVERRVDDPYEPGTQLRTTFNRKVDVLEEELSNGRISEGNYLTGRLVQAVFERAEGRAGASSWNPGDRIDAETSKELSIIRGITDARAAHDILKRVERAIGTVGSRFLRATLVSGKTLGQYAADRGKGTEHGRKQVAGQFRFFLDGLTEAFAARGRLTLVEDERYGEADEGHLVQPVRGHREPDLGPVEIDANGVQVPDGQGYRLRDDPAMRWRPRNWRRKLGGG